VGIPGIPYISFIRFAQTHDTGGVAIDAIAGSKISKAGLWLRFATACRPTTCLTVYRL